MHKQYKQKSKSQRWGEWSEWTWHEEYRRWYRVRVDSDRNPDYQWDDRDTNATASSAESIPRRDNIDDLAQGMDRLGVGISTGSDETHEVTSRSHDAEASTGSERERHNVYRDKGSSREAHHSTYPSSQEKTYETSGSSGKRQAKAAARRQSEDEESDQGEDTYAGTSAASSAPQAHYDPSTGQYYYPQSYTAGPGPRRTTTGYVAPEEDDIYVDDRAQAAIRESQTAYYGTHGAGAQEASSASASSAYGRSYEPTTSATYGTNYTYSPYDRVADVPDRSATPKAYSRIAPRDRVSEDQIEEEQLEQLDPRYRVQRSARFTPGMIFKVEWAEPVGAGNDGAMSLSGKQELQNRFGTRFWVGFRRFIVVANDQGNCTCVPILTYGGKACRKHGVKPEKHGIIYQRGSKARLVDKEPKLGFASVRADLTEDTEKLSKESRVNYAKLVTIEHNVRVLFIGNIYPADWDIVRDATNLCWERKMHHQRTHNQEI